MKQFQAKDIARNTTDLWTAATLAPRDDHKASQGTFRRYVSGAL